MAECEKNRGRARSIKKRDRMKEVQGRTNKVLHRSSSLYEIRTRCAPFALPLGVRSFSIVRNQPVLRFLSFVSSTPRFYDFTLCLWFLRFLQFLPLQFLFVSSTFFCSWILLPSFHFSFHVWFLCSFQFHSSIPSLSFVLCPRHSSFFRLLLSCSTIHLFPPSFLLFFDFILRSWSLTRRFSFCFVWYQFSR